MYLRKVYSQNRFFFYLFLLFCLGQIFFIYKGVQNTPFFLYGMYSSKQFPSKQYTGYILEINGNRFNVDSLPAAEHEMIVSTIERYSSLQNSDFQDALIPVLVKRFQAHLSEKQFQLILSRLTNDSTDRIRYHQWLKRYLEFILQKKIYTMKVFTAGFSYYPQFHLTEKTTLFEI